MTRTTYRATLIDNATGDALSTKDAYAWNSGVRASEALVREYARACGVILTGSRPEVFKPPATSSSRVYCRDWGPVRVEMRAV